MGQSKRKSLTSDSVIFITEKKDTLYGIGFESDIELNNWKILQPTGVFNDDLSKNNTLLSQRTL